MRIGLFWLMHMLLLAYECGAVLGSSSGCRLQRFRGGAETCINESTRAAALDLYLDLPCAVFGVAVFNIRIVPSNIRIVPSNTRVALSKGTRPPSTVLRVGFIACSSTIITL